MKIFLVAGEPSGDRLGAALMAGLKALAPKVEFAGVGGPLMQAEGLQSLFPMEELSVMGIAEVLPKYFHLKRRIAETAEAAVAFAPRAMITIDSPDFCLRVARLVKEARPKTTCIHYVAPSVWAWRPKRAEKMARVIDHVLALLPFEPPYMTAVGMSCDFVGHPVATEPVATEAEAAAFRARRGIAADAPVVLALPGSRRGEVSRLAGRFGETLGRLRASHPGLRVVLPTVRGVADLVHTETDGWPVRPIVIEGDAEEKRAAFRSADVALAASGTVSLELAAAGTPMVIAYDMNWLSRQLIGRLLQIDTVTLVNLVSDTRTVPEFLGPRCQPELIFPALEALMQQGPERAAQEAAMALTMERLGQGGMPPGLRAAHSVLNKIG